MLVLFFANTHQKGLVGNVVLILRNTWKMLSHVLQGGGRDRAAGCCDCGGAVKDSNTQL